MSKVTISDVISDVITDVVTDVIGGEVEPTQHLLLAGDSYTQRSGAPAQPYYEEYLDASDYLSIVNEGTGGSYFHYRDAAGVIQYAGVQANSTILKKFIVDQLPTSTATHVVIQGFGNDFVEGFGS